MKHIIALPLVTFLLATPLWAEDEPSTMKRGAQLFFEGLKKEVAPALDGIAKLMEEAGPALEDFITEMGPKFQGVLDDVEDWSVYEAPEIQPNGDILIRRKPDAPEITPEEQMPQVEL